MGRMEILTGRERRRFWSDAQKLAILEEAAEGHCSVSEVARRHDIIPQQIYAWRRELREMAEDAAREDRAMFLPAVIEPTSVPAVLLEPEAANARLLPDAVVQVAMEVRGVPVMVAHGASSTLVASVIAALLRAR